ncbi:MAG: pectate lyase [Candidatus Hydrogenedentota bacterium]
MTICRALVAFTLVLLCAMLSQADARERTRAFPEAEGFGAFAKGGRGGRVIAVTNLEDYVPGKNEPIPGSLRAACEATGPRIVVFRVSGTIALKATLAITEPYLTLAGQSAPGDGVCLKDHGVSIRDTHDIVIRYLRSRPGDELGITLDALSTGGGSRNVILDHCSASWANDEVLSVSGAGQDNITVQWCFITESMNESHHEKGAHGYGTLLRTDGRVTFHHNLYAHHRTRCPRPGTYGDPPGLLLDFRNNVVYNWRGPAGYSAADPVRMNYVGNYLKPGPSTRDKTHAFQVGGPATMLCVADNVVEGVDTKDDWALISGKKEGTRAKTPFDTAPMPTDSAEEAFETVLGNAGATLPKRDAVDARVVQSVHEGTGAIIDSQADVGGWPEYAPASPPADTDQDGMPDKWEKQHGLNPQHPADNTADPDGDGYTNIEEFLNGTDPKAQS